MSKTKTYKEIKEEIEKRNGLLKSKEYINSCTKLDIICKLGHEFRMCWSDINSNHWCPICAGLNVKSYKEIKAEIEKRHGLLKSSEYKNNRDLLDIICEFDHKFKMCWSSIQQGHWCPSCFGNKPKTYEEIKVEIKKRKGILKSKDYINNRTKLDIICELGHKFKMCWHDIGSGNYWCPYCFSSKPQKLIIKLLKEIFPNKKIYYDFKDFDWLKTGVNNGKQELDIWIPDIKLAIEYDGEQHFKPICFGGISKQQAQKQFKKTKYLDKLKDKKINEHRNEIKYFLRINYKEKKLINKEFIINKLKSIGINIEEINNA